LRDYAPDPGGYSLKVLDRAMKGAYDHYFPGAGAKITFNALPAAAVAKEGQP
jgi:hypothetical protein